MTIFKNVFHIYELWNLFINFSFLIAKHDAYLLMVILNEF